MVYQTVEQPDKGLKSSGASLYWASLFSPSAIRYGLFAELLYFKCLSNADDSLGFCLLLWGIIDVVVFLSLVASLPHFPPTITRLWWVGGPAFLCQPCLCPLFFLPLLKGAPRASASCWPRAGAAKHGCCTIMMQQAAVNSPCWPMRWVPPVPGFIAVNVEPLPAHGGSELNSELNFNKTVSGNVKDVTH